MYVYNNLFPSVFQLATVHSGIALSTNDTLDSGKVKVFYKAEHLFGVCARDA